MVQANMLASILHNCDVNLNFGKKQCSPEVSEIQIGEFFSFSGFTLVSTSFEMTKKKVTNKAFNYIKDVLIA